VAWLGIAQQQIEWLVSTREAITGLRARGMVANPHSILEGSVNGSLEAAFAI
jgi:hypothetical protein